MASIADAFHGMLSPEALAQLVAVTDPAGVATAGIADSAVTTAKLATAAVTKAKSLTFFSAEVTGTGSSQNTAHGLAATPAGVLLVPTELVADLAAGYDAAEGTHTSTNVVATVTSGLKYKIFAWA